MKYSDKVPPKVGEWLRKEDKMRGEPVITVTCDKCKCEDYVGLTTTARGYDERDVDRELEEMGWKVEGGQDICPTCAEEMEVDPEEEEEIAIDMGLLDDVFGDDVE